MIHDIESYLGDSTPRDFDSREEIEAYFSLDNLRSMFGDEYAFEDREAVMVDVIEMWEEADGE